MGPEWPEQEDPMADQDQTHRIREDRLPEFERRFAGLARIAAKLDVAAPHFRTVGEQLVPVAPATESDRRRIADGDPTYPQIRFFLVEVTGEAPRVPGFRFVGKVEPSPVAGVNFVATMPGTGVDGAAFATRAIECEHCATRRARRAAYLIESTDTGRVFLVGRSCLKDFTGHASPEALARFVEFFLGLGDDDEHGGEGRGIPTFHIRGFLAMAAACIDADGWRPATHDYPTRAQVRDALYRRGPYRLTYGGSEPPQVTKEHVDRADAALAWARSLSADPVVNRDQYLLNLRLSVESDVAEDKRAGIVVSVFRAHARATEAAIKLADRARRDGEAAPLPAFGDARVEIEGTVASASWRETDFGMQLKIVVRHADGWSLWGSAPAALGNSDGELVGRRVRFFAKVEPSRDKPSFGFFRRPTKAVILPEDTAAA